MEIEQIVNFPDLEETDSGVLNCSVFINGDEYSSESFDLQVYVIDGDEYSSEFFDSQVITGKKFIYKNYFVQLH